MPVKTSLLLGLVILANRKWSFEIMFRVLRYAYLKHYFLLRNEVSWIIEKEYIM